MKLTVLQATGPIEIVTLERQERPENHPPDLWNRVVNRRGGSMWWCELADGTCAALFADQIQVSV